MSPPIFKQSFEMVKVTFSLFAFFIVCIISYPFFVDYVYPLSRDAYFGCCTLVFSLYYIASSLFKSHEKVVPFREAIQTENRLNKDTYKVMFQLIGQQAGIIWFLSIFFTYSFFALLDTHISIQDAAIFFFLSLILFAPFTLLSIKLIKTIPPRYKLMLGFTVLVNFLGYFASLELLEFWLGVSLALQVTNVVIDPLIMLCTVAIFYIGFILGFSSIWHFIDRLFNRNVDVMHIMATSQRNANLVKGQHYLLLMFANSTFLINFFFIPLYFYSLYTFNTQSTLLFIIVALNLPFLIKIAKYLEHLTIEYFFILFKSVLSTIAVSIIFSHALYLVIYLLLNQMSVWVTASDSTTTISLLPGFLLYFVNNTLSLSFILSYVEGVFYGVLCLIIIVWLYAIFIRKERYRLFWFAFTVFIFGLTVYYDNKVTPEKVTEIAPWILPPEIFIFTAFPFLILFIINSVVGPYRISRKCDTCQFKAPKFATYCPCCGSYLITSKPMKHRLLAAYNNVETSIKASNNESEISKATYKQLGIIKAISFLGLTKQINKIEIARLAKQRKNNEK